MSRKVKPIIARNAKKLAEIMGLNAADAVKWEFRHQWEKKARELGLKVVKPGSRLP